MSQREFEDFLTKVANEVIALAEQYPTYCYCEYEDEEDDLGTGACLYTQGVCLPANPAPGDEQLQGCIVGQAVAKAEPKFYDDLRTLDACGDLSADDLMERLGAKHFLAHVFSGGRSGDLTTWLSDVQTKQDEGMAWGECLEKVGERP